MTLLDEQIYSFRSIGFAYFPQAVNLDLRTRVRAAIDRLVAEEEKEIGIERLEEIDQRCALRNLADRDPVFVELANSSPVYPVVDEVIGDARLGAFDALGLMPGRSRYPWDFHTDLTPFNRVGHPAETAFGATCLYYFDDADAETGATWVVPGSQRSTLPRPPDDVLAQRAEQVVVQAGDAVLFDARLWHCTSFNNGENTRWIIKQMMIWPWLRPMMDFGRSVRPEVKEQLPPRVRGLVGDSPPATIDQLRGLTPVV